MLLVGVSARTASDVEPPLPDATATVPTTAAAITTAPASAAAARTRRFRCRAVLSTPSRSTARAGNRCRLVEELVDVVGHGVVSLAGSESSGASSPRVRRLSSARRVWVFTVFSGQPIAAATSWTERSAK